MYTGNTIGYVMFSTVCPVYPCVYREHYFVDHRVFRILGLSLCIQGTLPNAEAANIPTRFIPVYTGNTIAIS